MDIELICDLIILHLRRWPGDPLDKVYPYRWLYEAPSAVLLEFMEVYGIPKELLEEVKWWLSWRAKERV